MGVIIKFKFYRLIIGVGFLVFLGFLLVFNASSRASIENDEASYLPFVFRPENTPTPTKEPIKTPVPTLDPGGGWLDIINYIRSQSGLPGVSSNEDWSNGCQLHSRYMVWNDDIGHSEDPTKPGYSAEGHTAAGESNVMVSGSATATDQYAFDLWMSGPFHGVAILDPQLTEVGFGSYRESIGSYQMGATLDVSRGQISSEPQPGTYPVMWPGNGQITDILGYHGTEWPDPLTSCPGYFADYANSSGPPIYLQIGSGNLIPNVTSTSFQLGTTHLEHCLIDETNYTNPSSSTQNTGRWILNTRDAIIIMPKEPLIPGNTYTTSITVNGTIYSWSFTATDDSDSFLQKTDTQMKSH